jgi:hypothetical protein
MPSNDPYFVQINATTASPSFVNSAITSDARLGAKTALVVLTKQDKVLTASV